MIQCTLLTQKQIQKPEEGGSGRYSPHIHPAAETWALGGKGDHGCTTAPSIPPDQISPAPLWYKHNAGGLEQSPKTNSQWSSLYWGLLSSFFSTSRTFHMVKGPKYTWESHPTCFIYPVVINSRFHFPHSHNRSSSCCFQLPSLNEPLHFSHTFILTVGFMFSVFKYLTSLQQITEL